MNDEASRGGYASFATAPPLDAGDGIVLRPIAGERIMLSEVTVPANVTAALHTHGEEKIGVVLSGSCEFTLGGVSRRLERGDVYHVPPAVPHGLRAMDEECVLLDVFSPVRPDLLERMAEQRSPR